LIFDEVTDKNKLAPFYGQRCEFHQQHYQRRILLNADWDRQLITSALTHMEYNIQAAAEQAG